MHFAFGCFMVMTFPQWRWPGQSSMSPPLLTVFLLNGSSCHLFQSRCITVKSTTARYVNVFVYLSCLFSRWSNNIDYKKGTVDRKCLQTVAAFTCWQNTSLIVIALQLKCASEILEHVFVSFQEVHLGSLQVRTLYFAHVYTISNLTKKNHVLVKAQVSPMCDQHNEPRQRRNKHRKSGLLQELHLGGPLRSAWGSLE